MQGTFWAGVLRKAGAGAPQGGRPGGLSERRPGLGLAGAGWLVSPPPERSSPGAWLQQTPPSCLHCAGLLGRIKVPGSAKKASTSARLRGRALWEAAQPGRRCRAEGFLPRQLVPQWCLEELPGRVGGR